MGFDDSATPILAGRDAFFAERMAAVIALPSPNSLSSSIAIFRLLTLRVVECLSSFSGSMDSQNPETYLLRVCCRLRALDWFRSSLVFVFADR
jgi:hypothetical protein